MSVRSVFLDSMRASEELECWATPSVLMEQDRLEDVHRSDISISVGAFGSLLDHSGEFGEVERLAARVRGADRSFLMVDGSSGANAVVMRALALSSPAAPVLVWRGCHHSVLNAAKVSHQRLRFLPKPLFDEELEALIPPSPDVIEHALRRHPDACAVIITSPSYEGLGADITGIAEVVHRAGALLVVDQAWGAHLGFHPALGSSATTLGADLVVESTHKQGGALQQTALLHAVGERLDPAVIDAAYRERVTTSPSFHLIGSIDATLRAMEVDGHRALDGAISAANDLRRQIADAGRARVISHPASVDPTKVLVALDDRSPTGDVVADALARRGVVVEKAGLRTVLFLATMQLREGAADRAASAFDEVVRTSVSDLIECASASSALTALPVEPTVETWHAAGLAHRYGVDLALEEAVGEIAAETIEVYPPGVPVVVEGYPISKAAIGYLKAVRTAGGRVISREPDLRSIRVLPSAAAAVHAA